MAWKYILYNEFYSHSGWFWPYTVKIFQSLLIYDLRACILAVYIRVPSAIRKKLLLLLRIDFYTSGRGVFPLQPTVVDKDGSNTTPTSEIKWRNPPWRYNISSHFFLQKVWKYHDLGWPVELGSQNIFFRVIVQG